MAQPAAMRAGWLSFSSATASLLLRHEHGTIMEGQSGPGRLLRSPARRLLRLDGLDAPAPSGTSSAADWNRHTADGIRYKLGSTGAWPTLGSSNTPEAIASARRVGRRRLDAARGKLAPAAELLVGCWEGGNGMWHDRRARRAPRRSWDDVHVHMPVIFRACAHASA